MGMRAIWDGMISFGLVNIPIALFTATKDRPIQFHFLHQKDEGRIRNLRVCEKCHKEVPYKDIARGYEFEKGQYVILTEKDLDRISLESTKHISITEFVNEREIDPLYFDKPYYLAPGRNGEKAYLLLREVLKRTQKVGIGKLVLHTHEQLGAIRTHGSMLLLELLRFNQELRQPPALKLPSGNGASNSTELKIAEQLIGQLTARFNPRKYEDTYQEALLRLIKQKLAGRSIRDRGKLRKATAVVDLMSKLKASLKQVETDQRRAKKKAA
jgi:DNA end-binding protein Ku